MKALIYIVMTLVAAATAQATAAGKGLPEFAATGTLDRVDFKSREIVIGDIYYRLGQNLIVHDEKGRLGEPRLLRRGIKVGVSPYSGGSGTSGQQSVYEIWVLPKDYDLSEPDNDR